MKNISVFFIVLISIAGLIKHLRLDDNIWRRIEMEHWTFKVWYWIRLLSWYFRYKVIEVYYFFRNLLSVGEFKMLKVFIQRMAFQEVIRFKYI